MIMKILIGKNANKFKGVKIGEDVHDAVDRESKNSTLEKKEIKNIRGRRSKYYSLGRNRMMTEIYAEAVHYYDYNDKAYKDIDLSFDEKDDVLETKSNSFKARFSKHPHNGKIFEMEKDLCKVGLALRGMAGDKEYIVQKGSCREHEYASNCLFLKNAKQNTDFEYIVTPKRIKENIIINDRSDKYEFDFDLALDNIAIEVSWDGKRLELMKKDSGRPEFFIPAPYMFDANGEKSDEVYYEIDQDNLENIKLKVIADANWINAAERKFPVTIDPIVETFEEYGAYYEDADYEQGIFRYYTTKGEKIISEGGKLQLKNATDPEEEIGFNVCILKNKLKDYLRRNYTQVLLKLKLKPGGQFEGFAVGGYDGYTLLENGEITVNITSFFASNENEIEIDFRNYGRHMYFKNNASFYPPVLQIEYNNYIKTLEIQSLPTKTAYIPGESFDPTGMEIVAVYDDGQTVPVKDYQYTPAGALASYDSEIVITYDTAECSQPITVEEGWVDDRRALENRENMYQLQEVDSDGNPKKDAEIRYVKLTLFDGLEDDSAQIGTPLNAASLNNLRVKAENIVGKIKKENLPDDLQWEVSAGETAGDEPSNN